PGAAASQAVFNLSLPDPATSSVSTSDFRLASTSAPQQASIRKEKPLKEVVAIMEQNYNFVATQRMYKGYFQKWGIKKNVTGGQVRDASLRAQQESFQQLSQQLCTQNLNPLARSDRMDTTNGRDLERIKRYVRRKSTGLMQLPPEDRQLAEAYFGSPNTRRAHGEATNVPMIKSLYPDQNQGGSYGGGYHQSYALTACLQHEGCGQTQYSQPQQQQSHQQAPAGFGGHPERSPESSIRGPPAPTQGGFGAGGSYRDQPQWWW
ncbi:hypothetical protein F5883DRAFT_575708, partial [Diaporthe sp. PMI_573]